MVHILTSRIAPIMAAVIFLCGSAAQAGKTPLPDTSGTLALLMPPISEGLADVTREPSRHRISMGAPCMTWSEKVSYRREETYV